MITRIKLYPSHNNIRKIIDYYFPKAYRIEISNDGKTWITCIEKNPAPAPGGKPVDLKIDPTEGRYVRLVATELNYYKHRIHDYEDRGDRTKLYAFSLAELEIVNEEKIISAGCEVTYKDALIKMDREDGYDPDMLTDGITNTPPYPKRRSIPPSPLLRKMIELKEKPVQAIAYVSALGIYDISLMPNPLIIGYWLLNGLITTNGYNTRSMMSPTCWTGDPMSSVPNWPTDGMPVCLDPSAGVNIFQKEGRMALIVDSFFRWWWCIQTGRKRRLLVMIHGKYMQMDRFGWPITLLVKPMMPIMKLTDGRKRNLTIQHGKKLSLMNR